MTSLMSFETERKRKEQEEKKSAQIGRGGASSSLARGKKPADPASEITKQQKAKRQQELQQRVQQKTKFRTFYDRGDLPMYVDFQGAHRKVAWRVPEDQLDVKQLMPLLVEGIRELQEPYKFLSFEAAQHVIQTFPQVVPSLLPALVPHIKAALNTYHPEIISRALTILKLLVQSDESVGRMLVPYYRQLLPVFNYYINRRSNTGDRIDFRQNKTEDLGDLIQTTLELLETSGGQDAFINIKYMIPTYESVCFN